MDEGIVVGSIEVDVDGAVERKRSRGQSKEEPGSAGSKLGREHIECDELVVSDEEGIVEVPCSHAGQTDKHGLTFRGECVITEKRVGMERGTYISACSTRPESRPSSNSGSM